jgi:hypothetical protein
LLAVGLLGIRLLIITDLDGFAFLAVGCWFAFFVCVIWAVKEYRRPSKWRHRPAWLDEFERDRRR